MSIEFDPTDYNNYYLRSNISDWRNLCALDKAKYFTLSLLYIKNKYFSSTDSIRVADYGAGNGSLCAAIVQLLGANSRSFIFEQFELSSHAIRIAKERNIIIHPLEDFSSHAPFDIIISCHVIEHLVNPRLLLSDLYRNTQFLIAEVPLELTIFSSVSLIQNSTGHINFYNEFLFKALLLTCGYEAIKIKLYNPSLSISRFSGVSFPFLRWLLKELSLHVTKRFAQYFLSYHCHGIFKIRSVKPLP